MKNLNVVITMGGLGSRFREVGYNIPKFMIEAKGRTLFEWSLLSLSGFDDITSQYIFIAKIDPSNDVRRFIKDICNKLNLINYKIILLDYLTDGQATTALLAKKYWNPKDSLLIYNIDTYVESGTMLSSDLRGDGFIPCFKAEGEHWSFVRLDKNGKAIEVREKERISDNCTLGAYYFKTCELYESLYNNYYNDTEHCINKEKYVAPLYNHLISLGGDVYISKIDSSKVHVLGTPKELDEFIKL